MVYSNYENALAFVCIAMLIAGLRYGLGRSNLPPLKQQRSTALFMVGIALWMFVVGLLAQRGFFSNFTALPPRLLLAILLPAFALAAVSFTSRSLAEALQHTPISWLFYLQTFRIFVELILWRGYKTGAIPIQMTFDGRNFDILAGLTAPIAGWIWQRTHNRIFGMVWNLAGLALLLNIVVVAILSMPTPLRVFTDGPRKHAPDAIPVHLSPGDPRTYRLHGAHLVASPIAFATRPIQNRFGELNAVKRQLR